MSCWSTFTWLQPFWLWNVTQPLTARAMRSVVSEAQMLVGRTSTWLRMPTWPSALRYPRNVRVDLGAAEGATTSDAAEATSLASVSLRSSELAQLCV